MSRKISDIHFFDFDFKLLHTENEFTSSSWTVYYNDIGTFEAHFDLNSDTLPIVMENDFLVAVQGNLSAIIVGKKVTDELIIYGRTCNWLLTKRITNAFGTTKDKIDVILNAKVKKAFSDVENFETVAFPDLPELTASRDDKCETFSFVQESLQSENLGHKLEFDIAESKWIFKILKGNDNNPLVISTINRNAYDVTAESDLLNLCHQGWYKRQYQNMGEWDPQVNALLDSDGNTISGTSIKNGTESKPIPNNFGKCWKVQFMDGSEFKLYIRFNMRLYPGDVVVCDNEQGILKKSDKADTFWAKVSTPSPNTGISRWEGLLSGSNEAEASLRVKSKIQGKTVGVRYGTHEEYIDNQCDYTLGDIVSVEWQSGNYKERAKKRIIGVNLWYEPENIGEEPIFEDIN